MADSLTSSSDSPRHTIPGGRFLWWTLSALALVLGYAALWYGSETLAPVLLVIGYCVLVPIAILKR